MSTAKKQTKKSFGVTAILFAISCFVFGFLFIYRFETGTTSNNLLRGILTLLFGILAVMNYVNYKRAKE